MATFIEKLESAAFIVIDDEWFRISYYSIISDVFNIDTQKQECEVCYTDEETTEEYTDTTESLEKQNAQLYALTLID